jgi:hypothetical protein
LLAVNATPSSWSASVTGSTPGASPIFPTPRQRQFRAGVAVLRESRPTSVNRQWSSYDLTVTCHRRA